MFWIKKVAGFAARSRLQSSMIWQIKLLSSKKFCEFCRERGSEFWCLGNDVISQLWQTGLLNADQIVAGEFIKIRGLRYVGEDFFGRHIYLDGRKYRARKSGLVNVFADLPELPNNTELFFHPFRFSILWRIQERLGLNINIKQLLVSTKGYKNIVDSQLDFFKDFTSTEKFAIPFNEANERISFAVACEPVAFSRTFGFHREPVIRPDGTEYATGEYEKSLKRYKAKLFKLLRQTGRETIDKFHNELCIETQHLDQNLDIHNCLRATKGDYRLEKVKGTLGGAMTINAAAEIIRRAAEEAFSIEMPEEDEIGYFHGVNGVKKHAYGNARLIDDLKARRTFLRSLGLDVNIRLRWYVEGETELGAIEWFLGNHPFIEIVNLHGLIVASRRRGLAFKENLLNDMKTAIYSFVSLDGDAKDNLRVLDSSIDADEMFGMKFVSSPDFETHNFLPEELAKVLLKELPKKEISETQKKGFLAAVSTANSAKKFFKIAKTFFPAFQFSKGKTWGSQLAQYADRHPYILDGKEQKTRPIIAAMHYASQAFQSNYYFSRKKGNVDRETGLIVYHDKK